MVNNTRELYSLERLSSGNSYVHRLHPTAKLLTAAVFIITVASFDRYAFGQLVPYIFYPAVLTALSETPYLTLLKRFLLTLPFCLFAGISNVFFDNAPAFGIGRVTVSYGFISLFTILFKAYLCVMAVLLLVSVTPLSEITYSMRRVRMPYILTVTFETVYRYIGVLLEEAYSMHIAYSLRSARKKGVHIGDMGSFLGQLLLRSLDRADRVYNAMKCRGYALRALARTTRKFERKDWVYCGVSCFLCIAFRVV